MSKIPEPAIFRGAKRRVMLKVFDFIFPGTFANGARITPDERIVSFRVCSVPNSASKFTAYEIAGTWDYNGDDFAAAWYAVLLIAPDAVLPDAFTQYRNFTGKGGAPK